MDAFTTALTWLARRELSTRQVRERLASRGVAAEDAERVIQRLIEARVLDDRRVAVAAARLEIIVRGRGRRRAMQRVQQLGIAEGIAKSAVDEVLGTVDEAVLLDEAIRRRLKSERASPLDRHGMARVVRSLVAQGFDASEVFARLRRKGQKTDG
jgi:SOS response regulatory protein OraA/RecX